MSAISLKSITGITSITTPAGVDNQLTLHNNNTTEAVKLDIAGNLHFHNHLNITGVSTASNFKTGTSNLHNTGLNVFDLDVDGHANLDNVSIAGVATATTFVGALTGTASGNPTLTSGANNRVEQDHKAYYRRMRYPDSYKCNTMYINKFEKNYKRTLRYRFVNVFPKSIDAVPVSYGSADILKVSVNFNYDRYIVNG